MTLKFFHRFRCSLFSIFFILSSFHIFAIERTFDEAGMRAELEKEATTDSYYSLSFPRLDFYKLNFKWTDEFEQKAKRLLASAKKNIRMKHSPKLEEMEQIVMFVEKAKVLLDFSESSSRYFHANTSIPYNVVMYKSGRTYILFEDFDLNGQHGGYKKFSRSIEYNSEKAHAHLVIYEKENSDALSDAIKELKIQTHFQDHEPILSFLDADVYTRSVAWLRYEHAVLIETELYQGDLNDLEEKNFDKKTLLSIFKGMAEAVQKFHNENYIHRDIKPDNFFYRFVNGKIEVVLGDFGLSESRKDPELGQDLCGTFGFVDPGTCVTQSHKRRAFHTFRYGKRADIFSLGVSFLVFMYGRDHELYTQTLTVNRVFRKYQRPMLEAQMQKAVQKFKNLHQLSFPEGNHDLNKERSFRFKLHTIIGKMLNVDPKSRIKIDEVVNFLKDLETQI